MIDEAAQHTIARLFDSGHKLVYEFTGAGSLALSWLHSVGGSSRLLLEANDRYCPESLAELLGRAPAKSVSTETAAAMAHRAYRRAVRLSDDPAAPCIGLACTATIATDRAKRGDHACHIAAHHRYGRTSCSLVMEKGTRDRLEEETLVAQLIVHILADAAGLVSTPPSLRPAEESIVVRHHDEDPIHLLLDDRTPSVTVHPDGRVQPDEPFRGVLLSGSFNPLHCGHETLLRVAGAYLKLPMAYELPVVNADKPPLSRHQVERRIGQFRRKPVILTRVPLFRQKAELYPRCTFVVGYDTAVRLVDPSYYGGDAGRDAALGAIADQSCRFLVAARPMPGRGVCTLADVPVPAPFCDLFHELPRSEFLLDLSSTELRQQTAH